MIQRRIKPHNPKHHGNYREPAYDYYIEDTESEEIYPTRPHHPIYPTRSYYYEAETPRSETNFQTGVNAAFHTATNLDPRKKSLFHIAGFIMGGWFIIFLLGQAWNAVIGGATAIADNRPLPASAPAAMKVGHTIGVFGSSVGQGITHGVNAGVRTQLTTTSNDKNAASPTVVRVSGTNQVVPVIHVPIVTNP